MSSNKKRHGQEDSNNQRSGGGGVAENKRSRRGKRLFVVLDDWSKGFSIHKIDADDFDDAADADHPAGKAAAIEHLSEPPALRLESPVGGVPHVHMFFSTLGTKMFVFMNHRCALVYDTGTAVMAVGPHAPDQMSCGFGITVTVGDMLYALSCRFVDRPSFQVMSWAPTAPDTLQRPTEGWLWKTLPAPPPAFTNDQRVTAFAMHPDGRTIFMTTAHRHMPGNPLGTFSFDTKNSVWRCHGKWGLPFLDQGYFDSELDSWVGLHPNGFVCSCQVASRRWTSTMHQQGYCHVTKEKLFRWDRDTHLSASLTYIGRSRFCLVETLKREEQDDHGCVLNLTMFGLKYSHQGELQVTNHRSTRSYLTSSHKSYFSPRAFYM